MALLPYVAHRRSMKDESTTAHRNFEELFYSANWEATTLGAPATWDQHLRFSVEFMLASKQAVFMVWGADHRFLCNEAYAPILGENFLEALGKPLRQLWAQEWERIEPFLNGAMRGAGSIAEDVPFRTWESDFQETCYFTFAYTPIRGPGTEIAGASCVVTDTTEKVLTQRAGEREREALREMFEMTPGFIAMSEGPEHRFTFANASYRRFVGRDDLIGKTVAEALPEIIAQGFVAILDQVYRTGEAFKASDLPIEIEVAPGITEQRYIDTIYQPVRDNDGKVTGIFVEGHDVTQQKLAKDALLRSQSRFLLAAEATGQIIWDKNLDTGEVQRIAPANPSLGELDPSHVNSEGWWDERVHPDDYPKVKREMAQFRARKGHWSYEYRFQRSDGSYAHVFDQGFLVPADGERRMVGAMQDVSAQKAAETRMERLQAELIHLSRSSAMGAMAATLAHELNQPLAAASNYLSASRRLLRPQKNERLVKVEVAIGEANQMIQRAGEIIRRMRDLVRSQSPKRERVELKALSERAAMLAKAAPDCPTFILRSDISDEVSEVEGDPIQIEQVMVNLIRNACQAMADKTSREIMVSAKSGRAGFAEVSVKDKGSGLPNEVMTHLFSAYRPSSTGGLGVGLSISRTIIEAHGGKIWAENNDDEGASFHFEVPTG
jgi:PAS domain S-box-containing protein